MAGYEAIYFTAFVTDGLRGWLSINGVPWLPTIMQGSFSTRGAINHRLVDGINTISYRLEHGRRWSRERGLEEMESRRWFAMTFHKQRPGTQELDMFFEYVLPQAWEDEGVDEKRRDFPYAGSFELDPGGPVAPLAYLGAETVADVPCEGTAELREAVREIYLAHANGDRDRILELCDVRVSDYERAYPGAGVASRAAQIQELDELLREKPSYQPLAEDKLHFESRAGGKVIHVARSDGEAVLCGESDETRYLTDLLLTKTPRGWRVM